MRDPRCYNRVSLLLLLAISIFAFFIIFPSTSKDMKLYMFINCKNHELLQVQKIIKGIESSKGGHKVARRSLRRIGSSPPRCASKCGKCRPCRPVHVPVPPGTPVTAEYYPEAWKCKCGNRLYTP